MTNYSERHSAGKSAENNFSFFVTEEVRKGKLKTQDLEKAAAAAASTATSPAH